MKLAVDEAIEIEMDPWSIEQAQKHLDEISLKYRKTNSNELDMGRFDQIMQAMFTILFFAQMEKQNPGVLNDSWAMPNELRRR